MLSFMLGQAFWTSCRAREEEREDQDPTMYLPSKDIVTLWTLSFILAMWNFVDKFRYAVSIYIFIAVRQQCHRAHNVAFIRSSLIKLQPSRFCAVWFVLSFPSPTLAPDVHTLQSLPHRLLLVPTAGSSPFSSSRRHELALQQEGALSPAAGAAATAAHARAANQEQPEVRYTFFAAVHPLVIPVLLSPFLTRNHRCVTLFFPNEGK